MGMIYQVLNEAWRALRRNRTRSALTMLGIVWGIATVTLLIAYGGSFREILGQWLQCLRQRRSHLLAAADQRTTRRPARRQESRPRASRPRHDQGNRQLCAPRLSRDRTPSWHRLRRPHGRHCARARRLPRIRRYAQRTAVRGPLDQLARRTRTPPRGIPRRARARAVIRRTPRRRRNRRHRRRALYRDRHHGSQDPAEQLFFQRRRVDLDSLLRRQRSVEREIRQCAGV